MFRTMIFCYELYSLEKYKWCAPPKYIPTYILPVMKKFRQSKSKKMTSRAHSNKVKKLVKNA